MVQVNAIGDACPIPVIKTLHALRDLNGAGTVQTLVDNEIAVQNLTRLAEARAARSRPKSARTRGFCVTITTENSISKTENDESHLRYRRRKKKTVVVISADHMGEAMRTGPYSDEGFIFALTQQGTCRARFCSTGGARLTCEDSAASLGSEKTWHRSVWRF